ncbi:VanZ family protein [Lentilactobacillus senioris]|uniref:VanZ family protein n=1 Tax=Lentilactobacillus senioris TaxID=931534 RepID=UPI003D2E0976
MVIAGKIFDPMYILNPLLSIFILIPLFIILMISMYRRGRLNFYRFVELLLFMVYVYFLIDLTQFPVFMMKHSEIARIGYGHQYMKINLNLTSVLSQGAFQVIGNLVMLLPLSIFVAYLFKVNKFQQNLSVGLSTTFGIELIQLVLNYFYFGNRTFDINDLVLNTIGYIIGYGLYKISSKSFNVTKNELALF